MHPNHALIERFYAAFAARDAEAMVACYHPSVAFSDPVFVGLDAPHARGMWRMLTARAADLRVESSRVSADDASGRAHWEAWYTFSQTKRAVHNVIDATFTFADGKIVRHTDVFDLWSWTRQALGPTGALLGWAPPFQGALRKKARAGLDAYLAQHPEAASEGAIARV